MIFSSSTSHFIHHKDRNSNPRATQTQPSHHSSSSSTLSTSNPLPLLQRINKLSRQVSQPPHPTLPSATHPSTPSNAPSPKLFVGQRFDSSGAIRARRYLFPHSPPHRAKLLRPIDDPVLHFCSAPAYRCPCMPSSSANRRIEFLGAMVRSPPPRDSLVVYRKCLL
jgi:hypothetical protein